MCDSGKSLFGVYNDNFIQIVSLLTTFVTNTKTFMETVKMVFKQKGFVASGLSTQIRVAPKPVNFSIG